jgi:aminoglycoside 6-adenylyltransferase
MRTEKIIVDEILTFAEKCDEVCAVIRTELIPVRDYLWTYNFYFVVKNVNAFEDDRCFESSFGERILLYRGDKNYPELFQNTKAHLMVYKDGVTIVINVIDRKSFMDKYEGKTKFDNVWIGDTFQKLLDKDGILPPIERLEEKKVFLTEKPTESMFLTTCSKFYWVLKSFAEYILRKELVSAMFYLNVSIRDLLNKLLHWYITMQSQQPVEIGILDSNLEKLLEADLFQIYKKTYPTADYNSIWEAFHAVVSLWSVVGHRIAEAGGFSYPEQTEREMLQFIEHLNNFDF